MQSPGPSINAVQVQLLLLRSGNVPNAELFGAQSDRDLGLLAVKYGVELPRHLAHLPLLPAPKPPPEEREPEEPEWDPMAANGPQ